MPYADNKAGKFIMIGRMEKKLIFFKKIFIFKVSNTDICK